MYNHIWFAVWFAPHAVSYCHSQKIPNCLHCTIPILQGLSDGVSRTLQNMSQVCSHPYIWLWYLSWLYMLVWIGAVMEIMVRARSRLTTHSLLDFCEVWYVIAFLSEILYWLQATFDSLGVLRDHSNQVALRGGDHVHVSCAWVGSMHVFAASLHHLHCFTWYRCARGWMVCCMITRGLSLCRSRVPYRWKS